MRIWLINLWDSYRTGLWFVPSMMILAAIILGFALPEFDQAYSKSLPGWMKTTGETAKMMLGSLSSAMLTTAGVVFSVTVVTLSITASQLGPRLLRNFMGQAVAQITLGCCLATCVYCLLLMRKIDDYDGKLFVPHLSVIVATVMSLLTLCIVVYFIHNIAWSIQPTNVVASVAAQLDDAVARVFPERIGKDAPEAKSELSATEQENLRDYAPVAATGEGYVVTINTDGILAAAIEAQVIIELNYRPGEFVCQGVELARVIPAAECTESLEQRIGACFVFGNRRTPRQDVECAANELVEIAIRALSPGINDPFTAVICVDRLGAALRRLADRTLPSPFRSDEKGTLRVIARPYTFHGVMNAAFDQIRQYGATSASINVRLLETFALIAEAVRRPSDREAIARQAQMVLEGARQELLCAGDVRDVEQRYERLQSLLEHE